MSEVELDGSVADGLEIDEDRSVVRTEDVAGVRFAMEQLLRRANLVDRATQVGKAASEQFTIVFGA